MFVRKVQKLLSSLGRVISPDQKAATARKADSLKEHVRSTFKISRIRGVGVGRT